MKKLCLLLGFGAMLLLPTPAMAHGSIFTYKYIDGANMVMVTHNVHDAQSGQSITYNLRLYSLDGQLVPFQKVQAQVKQGGNSIFTKELSMSPNDDVNLEYTYPNQGEYVLTAIFLDNGKQIAYGEFPIAVAKGLDGSFFANAFTPQTAVAFTLGVCATTLYVKRDQIKLPKQLQKLRRKK
jgi:hypothetical protein